jgi:alcohol dehydrogenase class IV
VRFEFATAARVVFGPGSLEELGPAASALGRRALLVVGRSVERAEPARARLERAGVASVPLSIAREPTVDDVREGLDRARSSGVDVVVGCGGGSVLDAAKAVAALLGNGGDPLDYLEVVGRGQPISKPSLPWIAVPTTAGTGSEVTRNAVLASPGHRVKASLRSPLMLARVAIVDPVLLASLPPPVVASSGLDAFSQLLEPLVSVRASPMVDGLCREGLAHSARSLRRAFDGDRSEPVLTDLALASLFGGLALANAGLGAVHGIAGPAGGTFDAPHGALCAALLPAVMDANLEALRARAPESPALARYREIAAIVTGRPEAETEDGVAWVRALVRDLRIPGLSHWGVGEDDVAALVAKATAASSMRGNPVMLEDEEIAAIVRASLPSQD